MAKLNGVTLKEGDRVRVISGDKTNPVFGINSEMPSLIGFIGEITGFNPSIKGVYVRHFNSTMPWTWHIDDLELHKSI